MKNTTFKKILDSIDKDTLLEFYREHSARSTAEHFNISIYILNRLLKIWEVTPHTAAENRSLYNLEVYGVANVFQSNLHKEKAKQTKLERYGNINYNNPSKTKQTCLDKYGTLSASGDSEVRERIKKTCLEKYGVDNPFKDVAKMKQSYIDKNGSLEAHYKISTEHQRATLLNKYGVVNISQIPGNRTKALESMRTTCLKKYGVEYNCLLPQCVATGNSSLSAPNLAFKNLLEDNGIEYSTEFPIHKRLYDFKINTDLVEIDPFATHNSTWGIHNNPINKNYHYEKSKLARENNYRCIHVWDWDDPNKIINLLKAQPKIYARKCSIKEISKQEADLFIDKYHLQGKAKASIYIGLFYNNELVSVMTFGKPRYNKNYQYELVRYCSSYSIIGGAEKLFSYFKKIYNPESIISYCDLSKFDGHTYTKLGFTLKRTTIGRHWYNPKENIHITDNLLRQRGFDQLFGTNYGKGTSNDELMIQHGFIEIYDAGQATYIYKS